MSEIQTIVVCTRCGRSFDRIDVVHTWQGHSWSLTCVACNHAAMGDRELLDRISANHQHGHWTQAVAREMALAAARSYVLVMGTTEAAGAAGRLNALVELIARIERRGEPDVMLEILARAGMRLETEKVSRSPSAGNQNGRLGGGACDSSSPGRSTSNPWPIRGGAA